MQHRTAVALSVLALALTGAHSLRTAEHETLPPGMYVCISPLVALNFWNSILHVTQELKFTLTHDIVAQLARDNECIRITSSNLRPIKSGWGGALAVADGDRKTYSYPAGKYNDPHYSPKDLGWAHPDYYVQYINDPRVMRAHLLPNTRTHAATNGK